MFSVLFLLTLLFRLGQHASVSDFSFSCELPAYPANGQYRWNNQTTGAEPGPHTDVIAGTILHYSCNAGYAPTDETAECVGNEHWTSTPRCEKTCILYGSYTVDYECFSPQHVRMLCDHSMPHNSSVRFECKAGHSVSGTQKLGEMSCRFGTWSLSIPECEPDCGLDIADGVTFIANAPVSKKDTLPWHVAIYEDQSNTPGIPNFGFICGGTILSTRLVVGAAHCFYDPTNESALPAQRFRVAANKHYSAWDHAEEVNSPKSEVREIHLHEWYKGGKLLYQRDIAILVLTNPFEFNDKVRSICFDVNDEDFDKYQLGSDSVGKFAGWGGTETKKVAEELRILNVPFIDYRKCVNEYKKYKTDQFLTEDKICAGYLNGSAGCPGDSGGGLVFPDTQKGQERWFLRGILSLGPRDPFVCKYNTYTAFTRLFALSEWLRREINKLSSQREIYRAPGVSITLQTMYIRAGCPLPAFPKHGKYMIPGQSRRKILPGEIVESSTYLKYSCDANYHITMTLVECQENGTWSYSPVCESNEDTIIQAWGEPNSPNQQEEKCKMMRSLTVNFRCTNRRNKNILCSSFLRPGVKVKATCKPWHNEPSEGLDVLTCGNDGNWDNPTPECIQECGLEKSIEANSIVNRTTAPKGSYTWHVGIFRSDRGEFQSRCGGSLIYSNIVITAAHCLIKGGRLPIRTEDVRVAAGKFLSFWDRDLDENKKFIQRSEVSKIYLHEAYKEVLLSKQYDLALLKLATPFNLSESVLPICLDLKGTFSNNYHTDVGRTGKLAGWGELPSEKRSEKLKDMEVAVTTIAECSENAGPNESIFGFTADKFCARSANGFPPCQGDSGSGLVFSEKENNSIRWYLLGVASTGTHRTATIRDRTPGCLDDLYTTFTSIFRHRDWLAEKINRILHDDLMMQ